MKREIKKPDGVLLSGFNAKKWCPGRKRQGIKLSPEKSHLPPEENFPVSPVAEFYRTS